MAADDGAVTPKLIATMTELAKGGVCSVGCPMEVIVMTEKEAIPIPPINRKYLGKAIGSNY